MSEDYCKDCKYAFYEDGVLKCKLCKYAQDSEKMKPVTAVITKIYAPPPYYDDFFEE